MDTTSPRSAHALAAAMVAAGLSLACMVASAAMPQGVAPAADTAQPFALPARFDHGLVYLAVSVNGHAPAWMMLDSGTSASIIDTAYARAIGLRLGPRLAPEMGFGNAAIATYRTGRVRLRVGSAPGRVVGFESIGLAGMAGPDGAPVAGLLGHSFLEGKTLVIDYPQQEVHLHRAASAADPRDLPMVLKNGIPVIQIAMAGQAVNSLIDTGGTYGMIVTPATADALGIGERVAQARPTSAHGHGGEQDIRVGVAPPFSVGTITVTDQQAAYTSFGTATGTIGAGVSLGAQFLKHYKLTLNYASKSFRLEP